MRARVSGPRLTSYRPAAAAFTPSALANGVEWFNAADTASITASSNLASQINGQLGVHNLTQSTGANQPASGTSTINGNNVLVFADSTDTLQKTSVTVSQPLTIWGVVKATAFLGTHRNDMMTGGSSNPGLYCGLGGSGKWDEFAGGVASATTAWDANLHLVIMIYNSSSSEIYVDGTGTTSLNPGTNNVSLLALGVGAGGVIDDGFSFCSGGWTSSAMSSGDRSSLRTWAQAVWGTP